MSQVSKGREMRSIRIRFLYMMRYVGKIKKEKRTGRLLRQK